MLTAQAHIQFSSHSNLEIFVSQTITVRTLIVKLGCFSSFNFCAHSFSKSLFRLCVCPLSAYSELRCAGRTRCNLCTAQRKVLWGFSYSQNRLRWAGMCVCLKAMQQVSWQSASSPTVYKVRLEEFNGDASTDVYKMTILHVIREGECFCFFPVSVNEHEDFFVLDKEKQKQNWDFPITNYRNNRCAYEIFFSKFGHLVNPFSVFYSKLWCRCAG